jgi:hypothetical protein
MFDPYITTKDEQKPAKTRRMLCLNMLAQPDKTEPPPLCRPDWKRVKNSNDIMHKRQMMAADNHNFQFGPTVLPSASSGSYQCGLSSVRGPMILSLAADTPAYVAAAVANVALNATSLVLAKRNSRRGDVTALKKAAEAPVAWSPTSLGPRVYMTSRTVESSTKLSAVPPKKPSALVEAH